MFIYNIGYLIRFNQKLHRRESGMEVNMSKTDHMNVIIMYADDLGFGDLSCYGSHRIHTPNLDKLCEEGEQECYQPHLCTRK